MQGWYNALIMKSDKLNIGCGNHVPGDWVNLDIVALPGVDVVHDIENLPLPFADNQFSEILCQDVLEHVEYVPVLKDLWRILKPGGQLRVRVPHFTSKHNFIDPTHRRMFSVDTFGFFVKNTFEQGGRGYYFDFAFSQCVEVKITFERGPWVFFLNPILEKWVNSSTSWQKFYESTGFSRLFPAYNIEVILLK